MINGEFKVQGLNIEQEKIEEVYFDRDIRPRLIKLLNSAQYTIWISLYFFYDRKLFNILKEKQNEGLNIQVIISATQENHPNKNNVKFFEFNIFDSFYRLKMGKGIMHDKFCIVDLSCYVCGSYNWTWSAAWKNKESIEIKNTSGLLAKYLNRFKQLKKEAMDQTAQV